MARLPRKAFMTFLDTTFTDVADFNKTSGATTPAWYLIGKDVEDMSVEMNSETEQTTNILDETTTTDNGYKPSISVDTYKVDPEDGDFYDKMKEIVMERLTGDACKTKILELWVDDDNGPYEAWIEDVIVKPTSYGGPTGSISVPYNINYDGNRTAGTVTLSGRTPTFTKASS